MVSRGGGLGQAVTCWAAGALRLQLLPFSGFYSAWLRVLVHCSVSSGRGRCHIGRWA